MTSFVEAIAIGMTMGVNAGIIVVLFLDVLGKIKDVVLDIGRKPNNE